MRLFKFLIRESNGRAGGDDSILRKGKLRHFEDCDKDKCAERNESEHLISYFSCASSAGIPGCCPLELERKLNIKACGSDSTML